VKRQRGCGHRLLLSETSGFIFARTVALGSPSSTNPADSRESSRRRGSGKLGDTFGDTLYRRKMHLGASSCNVPITCMSRLVPDCRQGCLQPLMFFTFHARPIGNSQQFLSLLPRQPVPQPSSPSAGCSGLPKGSPPPRPQPGRFAGPPRPASVPPKAGR
jgi:hypothetical protein